MSTPNVPWSIVDQNSDDRPGLDWHAVKSSFVREFLTARPPHRGVGLHYNLEVWKAVHIECGIQLESFRVVLYLNERGCLARTPSAIGDAH